MKNAKAHFGIRRWPQQPIRRPLFRAAGEELAMAPNWKVGTWHDTVVGGMDSTQRWGEQSSDIERAVAGPAGRSDCDDGMGMPCPKLGEALGRVALAERQLLEFNHRLVNMLQMIVTLIGRHARLQHDPVARNELDALSARVHAAAALHRHLLPPRQPGHVNLGALIEDMAVAIEGITGLACDVDAEPVIVPGQVAMHMATAVNELAWNAHKHAYQGAQGGEIQIVCRRDADGRLRLSVADRGCGLPAGFDPRTSTGFGLTIVCGIARQFGGEIRVDSNQGTRFTLLLKTPRM
jgi:two-component sensor histidine kinase